MAHDASDAVIWRTVNPARDDDAPLCLHTEGVVTWQRDAVTLHPESAVSYGTYFGAFPSGYWRHSTAVTDVELRFETDAPVDVSVFGTDAAGEVGLLTSREKVSGIVTVPIELSETNDGWIWPEFRSHGEPVTVRDICWRSAEQPVRGRSVAVSITTFNREADCLALLQSIAAPGLAEIVGRVVVADQGSRSLQEAPGFAAVSDLLGARLHVIRQSNLGGSGGFSRGMLDAADGVDDFVLLLDDDVRLEPESISRLATFAAYCRDRTIVGAHMLSLIDPSRLHSFGERVDRRTMWWSAVDPALSDVDLSAGIRGIPALSRRIDVDFNGWWMCLVPTSLVREAGAALPYFIKWDDAEFGLRAGARGVPTVTLPGAALWHMPWTAKDDGLDWQAYFQLRNRVLTALLHGNRGVLRASFALDVNHVLCAQYGSAALRNTALRDILLGPAHLDPVLRAGPARATAILTRMGQTVLPLDEAPPTMTSTVRAPQGLVGRLTRIGRIAVHQLRPAAADAAMPRLARADGKWWALGLVDAAVVDAASGSGVFVFRRNGSTAVRELRRAIFLRWRLWTRWNKVARAYRDDALSLASGPAWQARFAGTDSSAR